jgi:FeoA domain.
MEQGPEKSTFQIPLTDLKENEGGMITRLEGGQGFQRKLRTLGIREGKK